MSASTVSISANPATRRRPVVVAEKKQSSIEMVSTDVAPATAATVNGDDKVSSGKDLSHSIRGEAVLERSRDVVQVKKPLPNSASALPSSRRTTRKGVAKVDKPRWQTVISVLTKNLLLLLVLFGFAQMVRRLVQNSGNGSPIASSAEFERRIAEVETFLKTTTKMMQVQVDVVDRKIENEIGGLRMEVNKKIEDKEAKLVSELKKLDGRTEGLEKSLLELKGTEWISKDDFDKFFEEFKKVKGLDHGNGEVNLDEVRAFAKNIVEEEIERHAADGLGRVDYALASGGAKILKHSEHYGGSRGGSLRSMIDRSGVHSDAEKMLRPSFGEPGQCFPLKGSSGFVQIKLRTAIIPEAITLEHVDQRVAYDRSSAPKDCRVSGWLQEPDCTDQVADAEKRFLLTEFTYDLHKSNAQTFNVDSNAGGYGMINMIRFDFTSNHGSPTHTCIYRLRVHGHEPDSVSLLATQS
ncbi:hypothetical protein NMG60_11029670 [Bertholletia excelsa]